MDDCLCNDLLLEIFSYLPMKEQIKCSQVSHRWRSLFQYSQYRIFSLKICKRQNVIDQLDFHQYHKFECNNRMHKLNPLNVIYYDSPQQLDLIIKNLLPQLKRLKALHCEVDSLYDLMSINLDTLMELELEHFEVIYRLNVYIENRIERLLSKLGPKLKHLIIEPKAFSGTPFVCSSVFNDKNYRPSSYFGRVGLELIENYCPNLEILKFEPLTFVIESLYPIRLPTKLKCLSLPKVRMSITELFSFDQRNQTNLNELHFFDINVPIFKIICRMQNLRVLKLGKIRINDPNDLRFIINLKNLEHLQFKLHYKSIDNILCEIMNELTKIRRLCLINCCLNTNTIKKMTSSWNQLEYLELHNRMNQTNITDECLDYLCKLDSLKSLAIPHSSITNKALCQYIEQSKIEQLDVSNCEKIDSIVFHKMVAKAIKNPAIKFYLVILGHKFYIKENLCKNLHCLLD